MTEDISVGLERGMFHIAKSMNYVSDTVSASIDKVLIFGSIITAGLMTFSFYLAKDLTTHAYQEKAKYQLPASTQLLDD